ncbi:cytidylyltransferase domain-containing protein [Candidatus Omnitrophota bacterium]
MRVVGFIPSKLNSERLPRKNVLSLNGIYLVNYVLRTLNKVDFIEDIIIFASEPSITEYIEKGLKYTFLKRPSYLDTNEAKVQDFINEFLKLDKADIIVLLHITSPFIKPQTVSECAEKVISGKYDCAFAAQKMHKFAWFKNKPLNYSLESPIPRTQDLEPVIFEQSGFYVFKRKVFEDTNQRLKSNAYVKYLDDFEGHDIDTFDDFKLAELMLTMSIKKDNVS